MTEQSSQTQKPHSVPDLNLSQQRKQYTPLMHTLLGIWLNRMATICLMFVCLIIFVAVAAPLLAPYDPIEIDKITTLQPPSAVHPLGTDERGRDILSRLIFASRVSLATGVAAVLLSMLIGVPTGLIAGFFGRTTDAVLMRFLDALLAFPHILLAMVILALLGPGSISTMIAIAIAGIPTFARLARASTLSQKEFEYVEAAIATGATPWRVIFRSILPNAMAPILVQISLAVGYAILLEAALSFFGLGTQPPMPSWGAMLSVSRGYLHQAPWYAVFPGAIITLLVLALSTFTDGLRDALDPAHVRGGMAKAK